MVTLARLAELARQAALSMNCGHLPVDVPEVTFGASVGELYMIHSRADVPDSHHSDLSSDWSK